MKGHRHSTPEGKVVHFHPTNGQHQHPVRHPLSWPGAKVLTRQEDYPHPSRVTVGAGPYFVTGLQPDAMSEGEY